MPHFKYEGRDIKGGKKSGKLESDSKREALVSLKEKGIRVLKIEEVELNWWEKDIYIGNPVKMQDFVVFLRQFATLLKAGVTVVKSTNILAHQSTSKPFRKALFAIEEDLRTGISFSEACGKHSKIFPSLFTNMVKVGEAGGNLDDTLENLADYYEKQESTRAKVKTALVYPASIGIFASGVIIFLLVSVVPTFVGMFSDFGAELPFITRFVMGASEWMQSFWWLIIVVIIAIIISLKYLRSNNKSRYYMDLIALKIPLFGTILQKAAIARLTRTLSSLVGNSVPILQAISIVEKIIGNEIMAKVLRESRISLEGGNSFTEPLEKHWAFPKLVTQMIAIGETSGALDTMLGKVADFYETEVENATDKLKAMIEPIMIVSLALIVGGIVLAIVVPMFTIFDHVG
ncbi:type II secretion system protein F [Lottiidibacillus patelloidae]|uniref:Type II secretion system protein F n=1 Tax=Lottiidibacillus patelloidae TaxID=2670334 RepID=A0A263BXG4_9BACI|nr:type II secretion system F family protein [Lottiidibacillus patelloidae]OZM57866.1 type II secretion system protein F [Lottiidibacillus patelloidae]